MADKNFGFGYLDKNPDQSFDLFELNFEKHQLPPPETGQRMSFALYTNGLYKAEGANKC